MRQSPPVAPKCVCGYRLDGLPEFGKCPECGKDYPFGVADRPRPFRTWFRYCWPFIGILAVVAACFGQVYFAGNQLSSRQTAELLLLVSFVNLCVQSGLTWRSQKKLSKNGRTSTSRISRWDYAAIGLTYVAATAVVFVIFFIEWFLAKHIVG